jgi:hypothetical protein
MSKLFPVLSLLLTVFLFGNAAAECVTVEPIDQGSSYEYFLVTNHCRGRAYQYYISESNRAEKRKPDHWFIAGCTRGTRQLPTAKYEFLSEELPNGGSAELCIRIKKER